MPARYLINDCASTAFETPSSDTLPDLARRLSTLERMPKWLICVPLVVQWLWLSMRYRSTTLPSAANPHLTSGGLVGEGKLEYFRDMGPVARAATAPYIGIVAGSAHTGGSLAQQLADAELAFPLVAKPDLGLCGYGVRRVEDMTALLDYLGKFPAGEMVVLQPYLSQPGEAGVFYARDPANGQGRIIGLALRYFPRVVGDGRRTVAQLMAADPRLARLVASERHECVVDTTHVPATGECVRLATIGSTRVGGLYRDGHACITPALTSAIDAIARDMPEFHFGRFDVRFDHLRDLAAGTGFTIMEINGAGSEAIEAWDPETSLVNGLRRVFAKQRLVFAIGAANRRRGIQPIALLELARLNRRQNRLIDAYPPSN
ncbi:MAG: hypothetical protein H7255_01290 [Ramlibacter sp.]|nr:hypothetical protein [Ramlibacter sp.]